ncbi:MAG: DUF192 domain-containing protein [Actinomycetota bacterium]|nr:DUF192 domain-containing protein [Actinomycetota bacterium]
MTASERNLRILLVAAVVMVGLGLWAFVLRGADGPEDPRLTVPAASERVEDLPPPGNPDRVPIEGGFSEIAIAVEPEAGGDFLTWCLLAARDHAQRARGLMGVTDLQGYSGMAFMYDDDVQNPFHMLNTVMPLSIAWLDAAGDVVTISDMEPCEAEPCPSYPPEGPYRLAIEVPKGELPTLGITEGSRVTVLGACAPTG